MSTLQQIEGAIRTLSSAEFAELQNWLADYDAGHWDRQIEADDQAGRFDAMIEQAMKEMEEGHCTAI